MYDVGLRNLSFELSDSFLEALDIAEAAGFGRI